MIRCRPMPGFIARREDRGRRRRRQRLGAESEDGGEPCHRGEAWVNAKRCPGAQRGSSWLRQGCALARLLRALVPVCFFLGAGLALVRCVSAATGAPGAPVIEPAVRAKAARGMVRVVVELRLPGGFTPEGERPAPAAVPAQRHAIAQLQQAVLGRLAGTRFATIRLYSSVPLIALEIGADALSALEGMGDIVVRVGEDAPRSPSGGAGPGAPATPE